VALGDTFTDKALTRDWAAVMAMQGLLANSGFLPKFIKGTDKTPEHIAKIAYEVADAMLKQSKQPEPIG
jgi:hypothetical protein